MFSSQVTKDRYSSHVGIFTRVCSLAFFFMEAIQLRILALQMFLYSPTVLMLVSNAFWRTQSKEG